VGESRAWLKRSLSRGAENDLCLLVGGPSVRSRLCEACNGLRFMMGVSRQKHGLVRNQGIGKVFDLLSLDFGICWECLTGAA
jgi:hypothetical protein